MKKQGKGINLGSGVEALASTTGVKEEPTDTNEGDEGGDEDSNVNDELGGDQDESAKTETVKTDEAAVLLDAERKAPEVAAPGATLIPPLPRGPVKVRATKYRSYHPYFKQYIELDGDPTILPEYDNWTKVQVEAGLLELVKDEVAATEPVKV